MIRKSFLVTENQRGLLIKDGRLIRVLEPGRHKMWDVNEQLVCELFDARGRFDSPWAEIMEKCHPALADQVMVTVRVPQGEVAVIYQDDKPTMLVRPGEVVHLWKVLEDVRVDRINVVESPQLTTAQLVAFEGAQGAYRPTGPAIVPLMVGSSERGLVFFDGNLTSVLGPGRYGFWQIGRTVKVRTIDVRPQPLEVTAQEILTKDRVSLRLTLTSFIQVTDAEKAVLSTPDYSEFVYRLVQFAVREAVSGRTLDEVLNDRGAVDTQIATYVRQEIGDIGIAVRELGIKDIILPGEMRTLINKVVEAEKTAQANVIRRREEVAATRSLLNTARLMDDNPTLLRLKELEALERVTEKIGRVDVHTGGEGLGAIVDRLVSLAPRGEQAP